MPDKPQKKGDNSDSDTLIDSAEFEELRKKYATFDDHDTGAKNAEIASPSAPEQKSSATKPGTPATEVTDQVKTQEVFGQEPEKFSLENLESRTSAIRIIYEEGDKPAKKTSGQTTSPSPCTKGSCGTPEQNNPKNPHQKKDTDRDFLAGMRIVYEESEEHFSAESKDTQPAPEQPFVQSEKVQPTTTVDSLFETDKPTQGLADLFEHAESEIPVKETPFKRFAKRVFPHKGDNFGEILRKTVLNIALLTMLVCGGILLNIYVVSPYLNDREAQKTIQLKTNSNLFAGWATAKDKYPDIDFPTGMQLKFAELFVTNKDFSGWLSIPGTGIDLPVVRGKDNDEYLKKSFYGEKSKYGCCFIDTNNDIAKLDRNTVIYGHNMQSDNMMLGPLESYKKIDGFKSAPLISFSTLYKDTKWKVYAVFISNGAESGDNGYLFNYIFRNLSSDDAFSAYIRQVDQRKLYTTGVDILPGDKILTVSTCVYDFKDARLAVVARMVREGESEDVDLSKVVSRKSPRYPQAWYTAKGQTNPYKNAENWFPN